jgi:hypothetical protein
MLRDIVHEALDNALNNGYDEVLTDLHADIATDLDTHCSYFEVLPPSGPHIAYQDLAGATRCEP